MTEFLPRSFAPSLLRSFARFSLAASGSFGSRSLVLSNSPHDKLWREEVS